MWSSILFKVCLALVNKSHALKFTHATTSKYVVQCLSFKHSGGGAALLKGKDWAQCDQKKIAKCL